MTTPTQAPDVADELRKRLRIEQGHGWHPFDIGPAKVAEDAIAEVARQSQEIEAMREALEKAMGLIDRALGDTDPADAGHPLLLACQTIAAALSTLNSIGLRP